MQDYYQTLGVDRSASAEDIKRAYRRLASQHHPDKGGDKARFQEIQQAYQVLADDDQRRAYDNPGVRININGGAQSPFDIHDIFQQMFGQHPGAHQQFRRPTLRVSLWITIADVISGGRRLVSMGTTQGAHNIEIELPAGVNDGEAVRYAGIGPQGEDVQVHFRVHADSRWQRRALDLITDAAVNVWHLILGGSTQVQDPLGRQYELAIPAGCQPGTMLRLRGRGITARGVSGDLLIKVTAHIPQHIPEPLLDAIRAHAGK